MEILWFNSPANEEMILPLKLDSMIAADTSTIRGHPSWQYRFHNRVKSDFFSDKLQVKPSQCDSVAVWWIYFMQLEESSPLFLLTFFILEHPRLEQLRSALLLVMILPIDVLLPKIKPTNSENLYDILT